MGIGRALTAGTVTSVAVTAVWSWTATMTIGTAPSPHLTRDLPASYAQLADAATGNGYALFAVVAAIYGTCFLVAGLRGRSRRLAAAGRMLARGKNLRAGGYVPQ